MRLPHQARHESNIKHNGKFIFNPFIPKTTRERSKQQTHKLTRVCLRLYDHQEFYITSQVSAASYLGMPNWYETVEQIFCGPGRGNLRELGFLTVL